MRYMVQYKGKYLIQGANRDAIERRVKYSASCISHASPADYHCWTMDKNGNPLKLRFDNHFKLVDYSWVA